MSFEYGGWFWDPHGAIATANPVPRLRRSAAPSAPPDAGAVPAARRDHALALHRFLGGTQVFGGVTLAAAYGFGADALQARGAREALIALGVLQIAVGINWLVRTRSLRGTLILRPGRFVAGTLSVATAVMILGGSNSGAVFVTSAMAWLVAVGYALPGRRWLAATAGATIVVSGAWILVEGSSGGFRGDGHYLTAIIGLLGAVVPGLWIGRTAGAASRTMNRWHLVEEHERGLVSELRDQLDRIDRRAARVAALLAEGASVQVAALRTRLRTGIGVRSGETSVQLLAIVDELVAEYTAADPAALLVTDLPGEAHGTILSATTADALAAVIRRQLGNVARHAPNATQVTVRAEVFGANLRLRIEDDGHGDLPFRAGTGTAWSVRQLARVGGSARYFAGEEGVGFEATVPITSAFAITDVPGLSVNASLDRFAVAVLTSMRWAGYAVDSLGAYAAKDQIGLLWLAMPIAAALIELSFQFGVPGLRLTHERRLLLASMVAVAVTAIFAVPVSSPEALIPSTTSVVVLAHLQADRRLRWWLGAEFLRAIAVLPLLVRHGAGEIELLYIYPAGFTILVVALLTFIDRARMLERTAADAMGRAALAGATVRGLSLHHDAVDVILREAEVTPELEAAVDDLAAALSVLSRSASGALDPRDAILTGVQAALVQPVRVERSEITPSLRASSSVAGAVDRVTLIELAGLAADERSSCAPPGLLGRRRLKTMAMRWAASGERGEIELRLEAIPTLRLPDPRVVRQLEAVAQTLGVAVESSADALTLRYRQQGSSG